MSSLAGPDDGKTPRSRAIALAGIKTDRDFVALMDAIIADLADGRTTPAVANAQLSASGLILKVAETSLRLRETLPVGPCGELLLLAGPRKETKSP